MAAFERAQSPAFPRADRTGVPAPSVRLRESASSCRVVVRFGEQSCVKSEDSPSTLSMLTYTDLLEAIDEASTRARNPAAGAAWQRLRDVVAELAGRTNGAEMATSSDGWLLEGLDVAGFRGIGPQRLTLNFETAPGISVFRGPNGAGKSSIADAVEAALYGRVGGSYERPGGKGGNAALWEPEYVADGCEHAEVRLTLRRSAERLDLYRKFARDGALVEGSASLHRSGHPDDPDVAADLGRAWLSALDSHQPVFGYATWERRLQRAKDLQAFLDSLLALGGCFLAVQTAVDREGEEAKQAYDRWKSAWKEASSSLASVDDEYRELIDDPEPVSEPHIADDIDKWVQTHNVDGHMEDMPAVDARAKDDVLRAAGRTLEEVRQHRAAAGSLHEQLAGPLGSLHAACQSLEGEAGDECPVCSTQDVTWLETLHATIECLGEQRPGRIGSAFSALRSVVEERPLPLLFKMRPVLDAADKSTVDVVESLGRDFVSELDRHGAAVVTSTAVDLAAMLSSDDFSRLMDSCIERSDHHRRWVAARSRAATAFVAVWRQHQSKAKEYALWSEAKDRLNYLQTYLRKRRGNELKVSAARHVSSLLDDAHVSLEGVKIQATKAELDLTQGAVSLTMGMLSAGQRNAVLLAPLLAVAGGGPFRFLVLDDPVHAFDSVRVDRLADAIERLAVDQRVIVLTHDERFYEHLMAAGTPVDSYFVSRSAVTQAVTVEPRHEMWDTLLADAELLMQQADRELEEMPFGLTATVRGLCRQALDHGIRTMVLRHERHTGGGTQAALDHLDGALTTRERLRIGEERVRGSSEFSNRVRDAKSIVGPFLGRWNEASHSPQKVKDVVTTAEVAAARQACVRLVQQRR